MHRRRILHSGAAGQSAADPGVAFKRIRVFKGKTAGVKREM